MGKRVGLALSGGGIRSATFCLGVLRALHDADKTKDVTVISAISGGGYAGSAWCAAHQSAEPDPPIDGASLRALRETANVPLSRPSPMAPEAPQFLSTYALGLVSRLGFMAGVLLFSIFLVLSTTWLVAGTTSLQPASWESGTSGDCSKQLERTDVQTALKRSWRYFAGPLEETWDCRLCHGDTTNGGVRASKCEFIWTRQNSEIKGDERERLVKQNKLPERDKPAWLAAGWSPRTDLVIVAICGALTSALVMALGVVFKGPGWRGVLLGAVFLLGWAAFRFWMDKAFDRTPPPSDLFAPVAWFGGAVLFTGSTLGIVTTIDNLRKGVRVRLPVAKAAGASLVGLVMAVGFVAAALCILTLSNVSWSEYGFSGATVVAFASAVVVVVRRWATTSTLRETAEFTLSLVALPVVGAIAVVAYPDTRVDALLTTLCIAGLALLVVGGGASYATSMSTYYAYRLRRTFLAKSKRELRIAELTKGPELVLGACLNHAHDGGPAIEFFELGSKRAGWRKQWIAADAFYAPGGMALARAMAISGAAVAGVGGVYHSIQRGMTISLFNFSLGWNVRTTKQSESPTLQAQLLDAMRTPWWFFREVLAWMPPAESAHRWYLSDGGHTGDNLGLWPLVARANDLDTIVVCDAEMDPDYTLAGLDGALALLGRAPPPAVEGVELELKLDALRPAEGGRLASPVVRGHLTVRYRDRAPRRLDLIYVKASRFDELPPLCLAYGLQNPTWPHETTADQFFDSHQFDAMFLLGRTAGARAAKELV